jgi:hypothetical protein
MLKKSFLTQKKIEYRDMNIEELIDIQETANNVIRYAEEIDLPETIEEAKALKILIDAEIESRKEVWDEGEDY